LTETRASRKYKIDDEDEERHQEHEAQKEAVKGGNPTPKEDV